MAHTRTVADENTGDLRIFYGVFLDCALHEAALQMQQTFRQAGGKVSWVKQTNLHFTLRFIGDTPVKSIDQFIGAGNRAAVLCSPFQCEVRGVGAFPSSRRPRTIWLGATGADEQFQLLHRALSQALKIAGLAPLEKNSFVPHCTLGRVRDCATQAKNSLPETIAEHAYAPVGQMLCSKFCLIKSTLSPTGAVYETISTFSLAD